MHGSLNTVERQPRKKPTFPRSLYGLNSLDEVLYRGANSNEAQKYTVVGFVKEGEKISIALSDGSIKGHVFKRGKKNGVAPLPNYFLVPEADFFNYQSELIRKGKEREAALRARIVAHRSEASHLEHELGFALF